MLAALSEGSGLVLSQQSSEGEESPAGLISLASVLLQGITALLSLVEGHRLLHTGARDDGAADIEDNAGNSYKVKYLSIKRQRYNLSQNVNPLSVSWRYTL